MTGPSTRVKRMAPGWMGSCVWDGEGGSFVVLRSPNSNGAKAWLTPEQGAAMLAEYYGVDTSIVAGQATEQTWRTVLAKECDDGFHAVGCGVDDCEQGEYCAMGTGAKWADVLGITHDAAQPAGRAGSGEAR